MSPKYDLDKIKFGVDEQTWERAVGLYENGRVTRFKEELNGFFATVLGSHFYRVYVSNKRYDEGDCECYLGQNDTLCKHMVAVAICAVKNGQTLTDEDKRIVTQLNCSGKLGILRKNELLAVKKLITGAMRYIKSYEGPSRIWFSYQNSLSEGCSRLTKILSDLPVSEQTAKIIVDMLLRLDEKLCRGGVDDSDGAIGGFIEKAVFILQDYAKLDKKCIESFTLLKGRKTCFSWEEPLLKLLKNG